MPPDTKISEVAYAKINLALHVRARRPDGYHDLDTIFAFVNEGDHLSACHADQLSLEISGPYAPGLSAGEQNLVMKAAVLLQDHFRYSAGAAIHLDKRLPVASGIGGGSADAAAIARLLNRLWNINASYDQLAALLTPLGADIPACISSQISRGQGIGTRLSAIAPGDLNNMDVLLINPNKPVATGAVFAAWDGEDKGGFDDKDVISIVLNGRNDLQNAAIGFCPEIEMILSALREYKPVLARMSGSGATCFALFPNDAECGNARLTLQRQYPDWWFMQGRLR
jgi:4-diphosphocytidyl-2-C-methyl-D-erythritol kinase